MTWRTANFDVEEDTDAVLCLRDVGPWDRHPTITNDAETVVERCKGILRGRRLEYIDSIGERTELVVNKDGQFGGFRIVAASD